MIPNPNLAAGSGSASYASAAPASGSYPMSAPPAATSSSSSDSSGYSTSPSPNQYGQYGSSSSPYNQYGSSSSPSYNQYTSAPAQYTPPPQSEAMPYESFMSGGYKSMDCGYGYTKGSDGSCMSTQSWVRISHLEISHAIQFMRSNYIQYTTSGCYQMYQSSQRYIALFIAGR
jgi:hypothetical protein